MEEQTARFTAPEQARRHGEAETFSFKSINPSSALLSERRVPLKESRNHFLLIIAIADSRAETDPRNLSWEKLEVGFLSWRRRLAAHAADWSLARLVYRSGHSASIRKSEPTKKFFDTIRKTKSLLATAATLVLIVILYDLCCLYLLRPGMAASIWACCCCLSYTRRISLFCCCHRARMHSDTKP